MASTKEVISSADYDTRRVGAQRAEGAVSEAVSGDVRASQVEKVARTVRRRIGDVCAELPQEFRPAHVSVALIDEVFNPHVDFFAVVVPIVERYCRRFGLVRAVAPGEWPPPIEAQETLGDLIDHYDVFGEDCLRTQVFQSVHRSPGTWVYKANNVLNCARKLCDIGMNTLQDVQAMEPREIKSVLCEVHGIGVATVHMFLMYCGRGGNTTPASARETDSGRSREDGAPAKAMGTGGRVRFARSGLGGRDEVGGVFLLAGLISVPSLHAPRPRGRTKASAAPLGGAPGGAVSSTRASDGSLS